MFHMIVKQTAIIFVNGTDIGFFFLKHNFYGDVETGTRIVRTQIFLL
jgi:hypothetical protein